MAEQVGWTTYYSDGSGKRGTWFVAGSLSEEEQIRRELLRTNPDWKIDAMDHPEKNFVDAEKFGD